MREPWVPPQGSPPGFPGPPPGFPQGSLVTLLREIRGLPLGPRPWAPPRVPSWGPFGWVRSGFGLGPLGPLGPPRGPGPWGVPGAIWVPWSLGPRVPGTQGAPCPRVPPGVPPAPPPRVPWSPMETSGPPNNNYYLYKYLLSCWSLGRLGLRALKRN